MADSAYFVGPTDTAGPGVMILHSWWGLTKFFRRFADDLSDEGFTVLVPDLNSGSVFEDRSDAEAHLHEADPNHLARVTLSSARFLQRKAADPTSPIGVVGFSMGASLGLWASVRMPETIGAVVAFYGAQTIDFDGSQASYQLHLAEHDEMVSADESLFMEATIGLVERPVESFTYPGTNHWFFEEDRPEYDPRAAGAARRRMLDFLHGRIGRAGP